MLATHIVNTYSWYVDRALIASDNANILYDLTRFDKANGTIRNVISADCDHHSREGDLTSVINYSALQFDKFNMMSSGLMVRKTDSKVILKNSDILYYPYWRLIIRDILAPVYNSLTSLSSCINEIAVSCVNQASADEMYNKFHAVKSLYIHKACGVEATGFSMVRYKMSNALLARVNLIGVNILNMIPFWAEGPFSAHFQYNIKVVKHSTEKVFDIRQLYDLKYNGLEILKKLAITTNFKENSIVKGIMDKESLSIDKTYYFPVTFEPELIVKMDFLLQNLAPLMYTMRSKMLTPVLLNLLRLRFGSRSGITWGWLPRLRGVRPVNYYPTDLNWRYFYFRAPALLIGQLAVFPLTKLDGIDLIVQTVGTNISLEHLLGAITTPIIPSAGKFFLYNDKFISIFRIAKRFKEDVKDIRKMIKQNVSTKYCPRCKRKQIRCWEEEGRCVAVVRTSQH